MVVKAPTSSVSAWYLLSSAAWPPQFNSKDPRLSFLVSTLSWSEELCLFLSIFSLYLQCSSYRGKKRLSLCFRSCVALHHVSPSVLASYFCHCLVHRFLNVPFTFGCLASPPCCDVCRDHRSSSQAEGFSPLSLGSSSPQNATCSTNRGTCTQVVSYCATLGRQRLETEGRG